MDRSASSDDGNNNNHAAATSLDDIVMSGVGGGGGEDPDDSFYDNGDDDGGGGAKEKGVQLVLTLESFENFCSVYNLDSNGSRSIVIKFMLHASHFERDIAIRQHILTHPSSSSSGNNKTNTAATAAAIVPILLTLSSTRTPPTPYDILYKQHIKQRYLTSLYRYSYAIIMPRWERNLDTIWREERLTGGAIREILGGVGSVLWALHNERGVVHCDLTMSNVLRWNAASNVYALTDFEGSCRSRSHRNNHHHHNHNAHSNNNHANTRCDFPGSKFSSGILPPEMVHKLDLDQTRQYNRYWRHVSDDAKDLKLLTPDDVQAITDECKVLIEDKPMLTNPNSNNKAASHPDADNDASNVIGNNNNWRSSISSALAIMSFDDLPSSLASCDSITEFSTVWDRILSHAELWEKIKPRVGPDGSIYVVKTYIDRGMSSYMEDEYSLPYDLLPPSEKIDIWSFGCLLFALCSGGPLFKVNRSDDLDEVAAYAQLESWDRKDAENAVKKVADPLAQDLLIRLLVREGDRLSSMKAVLRHPFFGSTSNLEALKILEKHEEQQLLLEETTNIPLVTAETQSKLEQSTEKHCKIVFETSDVVAPTCLMALPYQLKWSITEKRLVAPSFNNCQKTAQIIGKHILNMNAATARLSFWLAMKKNFVDNNDGFKDKLTSWLQRGHHTETRAELIEVAKEVVAAIGYNEQYVGICLEMLQVQGEFNTHRFIKDPMGVAKESIQEITYKMQELYAQPLNSVFLYLMDEYTGVPVLARPKDDVYPILIHPSLLSTFLPFMNISAMAQTAVQGVRGLANLLGLNYDNIPADWKNDDKIHVLDQPSSVAEFAVLQDVLEKLELSSAPPNHNNNHHNGNHHPYTHTSSHSHSHSNGSDNASTFSHLSNSNGGPHHAHHAHPGVSISASQSHHSMTTSCSNTTSSSRLRHLEGFFRERDQSRTFSGLRRLCDGKGASPAMWTTGEVIQMIQDQALQASLEQRLKNLKAEWLKREQLQVEIAFLSEQLKMLCPTSKIAADALSDLNIVSNNNNINNGAAVSSSPSKANAMAVHDQHNHTVKHSKEQQAENRTNAATNGSSRPRKRSSWNFGRRPSFHQRGSGPNAGSRTMRKRQSWSAFEMPKKQQNRNDAAAAASNEAKSQKQKQQDSHNKPRPKRRQSFTNFIRKRLPSADAAEASAKAKYNKIQQSQQTAKQQQQGRGGNHNPKRPNARKRQSWSAFPSRKNSDVHKMSSSSNNQCLAAAALDDDDLLLDDDDPMFGATRQRSPSVDSIFRRPSTELGGADRRSSSDNLNLHQQKQQQEQQQQQKAVVADVNKDANTAANTARRSSWTDKLKKPFGGSKNTNSNSKSNRPAPLIDDPDPTFEEDNNNDAPPRRRRSSANQRRSWFSVGNNNTKEKDKGGNPSPQQQKVAVRPPPLIDDPDPDADDDEEYYKRPARRPIQVTGMFRGAQEPTLQLLGDDDDAPDPYSTVVAPNRPGRMNMNMSSSDLDANNGHPNDPNGHGIMQQQKQSVSTSVRSRLSLKGMFQRQRSGGDNHRNMNNMNNSNHGNTVNVNFDSYNTSSNKNKNKQGRRRSKSVGASASAPSQTTALYASNKQQQSQDANNVNVNATSTSKKGSKFRLPKIGRRRSRSVPERRSSGAAGAVDGAGKVVGVSYNGTSGYGVVM